MNSAARRFRISVRCRYTGGKQAMLWIAFRPKWFIHLLSFITALRNDSQGMAEQQALDWLNHLKRNAARAMVIAKSVIPRLL